MSFEWIKSAYETRFGNLTAKSVLVLIADQMNADGFGWPSIDFIASRTEIGQRTVRRVLQVFIEIELIAKVKRGRKQSPGIQLNTALLGTDLRADWTLHFSLAQGEKRSHRPSKNGLTDHQKTVSQTEKSGLTDRKGGLTDQKNGLTDQTPHTPLSCVPLSDPLETHTPSIPQSPILTMPEPGECLPPTNGKAEKVLETWNQAVKGTPMPQAKRLNQSRVKAITVRLRDAKWFAEFEAACRYVAADARYHGNNASNWVCDFDFLLKPNSATKVAEKATSKPDAQWGGMHVSYNRAQARTDGNIAAFRAAQARRNRQTADDSCGGETSSDQHRDSPALLLEVSSLRH